jgi:hypothetical protein
MPARKSASRPTGPNMTSAINVRSGKDREAKKKFRCMPLVPFQLNFLKLTGADLKNTFLWEAFVEYTGQEAVPGISANIFEIGSGQFPVTILALLGKKGSPK